MSPSTIYLGLDVHKDTITVAVLPAGAAPPTHVDRLSSDLAKLRHYCERLGAHGTLRLRGYRAVAHSHPARRPAQER